MTIKQKLGSGVLACMAVLTLAIGALVQIATERSVRIAAEQAVASAGTGLEALERADVARLDAALVALAANPALVDAFRARDRDRFLAVAAPIFEALRTGHDVTHFYAHDLAGVAFARVHSPAQFGDVVERSTLARAIETGERATGKELGRTAFALRVVTPWRVGGALIGYLELAEEIDHVLTRLKAQTGDDYALLVEKRFVDEPAWRQVYGERKPWGEGSLLLVLDTSAAGEAAPRLDAVPEVGGLLGEVHRGDRSVARGVVPITDAAGRRVGAVVVNHDITALHDALEKARAGILLTLAGVAAIMTMLLPWLVQRLVFARLQRVTSAMEDVGARLAGGEYDVPAPVPAGPRDEIGRFEEFLGGFLAMVGRYLKAAARRR